jgi:uncharacterized hydrophobic protein (TIGR00271 family)
VEEVLGPIEDGSDFSFDFLMLLLVASILAAVGLLTDNTVVIVASMLVSPIMGPVLGVTFGYTVRRYDLVLTGLRTETVALLICCAVGFLFGVCAKGIFPRYADHFPTSEMEGRGMWGGLGPGTLIALVSGIGVSISIMNRNINSLVGVAISASLLPPAVNAGICLALAMWGQQLLWDASCRLK